MSIQVEEGLKKMFAAYGRKPFQQQWDIYLDWTDKFQNKTVSQVIDKVIENEEKLPTIAKLQKEANTVLSKKRKKKLLADHEDCWFCQGTGYVPCLYKPNEISLMWYSRNKGCKCTIGKTKSIGKYFHHSQNIQFEKEAKLYPDLAYPQIVDMIKRMKNLELKP